MPAFAIASAGKPALLRCIMYHKHPKLGQRDYVAYHDAKIAGMEKLYLAVNVGSASKKCGLYRGAEPVLTAHFEPEDDGFVVTFTGSHEEKRKIKENDFTDAVEYFVSELVTLEAIGSGRNIAAVGFRVVAPGTYFRQHRIIDTEYLHRLEKARSEDPLHLSVMLDELKRLKKLFRSTPLVGVSDSAFHTTMPERAQTYALPEAVRFGFDILRFGYHGLSIASVVRKLAGYGAVPQRVVVCHLGSGSSIVALQDGSSIDTSMGFSPLEGVPMATRVGNIDAGALIHLARARGMKDLAELEQMLYSECGLLGLSGTSADMRALIELDKQGDQKAHLAIEVLTYRIRTYIGAHAAALGGIDLLVFSGTIGERSWYIRSRVCRNLEYLGIAIDEQKDHALEGGRDGEIQTDGSRIPVVVIQTDESSEIAIATDEVMTRSAKVR